MTRTLLIASVVAAAALSRDVTVEEVCKTTQLKNPALTLSEMYSGAEGDAKAWKPDAWPGAGTGRHAVTV